MQATISRGGLANRTRSMEHVIVFDIGGTWFRSGIATPGGQLLATDRRNAINYKNTPHVAINALQEALVDYLIEESSRLQAAFPEKELRLVGISMGAALNAHTGLILNSGPLWGPDCLPFDLLSALRVRAPHMRWVIVNDITAALLRYVAECDTGHIAKLVLVTVSTGVGCRTYVTSSKAIPVDRLHGLQGEIGHLAIPFAYKGLPFQLQCDCGGFNHLNAFSSGRGIEALLPLIVAAYIDDFRSSRLFQISQGRPERLEFSHFAEAIACDDAFANDILDAVTLPMARMLLNLFTFDPEVERVVFTGGVVHSLSDKYLDSLLYHLETIGLYQISARDPAFFRRRVQLGARDDNSGMLGAAIAALAHDTLDAENISSREQEHRWVVQSSLPVRYTLVESRDLFSPENADLLVIGRANDQYPSRVFVIMEAKVDELYGQRVREYFQQRQVACSVLVLRISEQAKTVEAVLRIAEELIAFGLTRRGEPVIAIGGGVLLDIVGLAASLYRRGTPYIRVPTTLISLIDAGIGIKTAVNFQGHKSRLGSYYPPVVTFLDRTFLSTLDDRQLRNGVAEIIKMAIAKDGELFALLEQRADALVSEKFQGAGASAHVIRRAIQRMLEELEPNLWEHDLNRLVDFGHSFSPALEMRALPELLHGEAVAVDMALSCVIAHQRGLINAAEQDRILNIIRTYRLPLTHPLCQASFLYEALQETVRHRDGLQRLVLPTAIGSALFFNDITFDEIERATYALKQFA